MGSALPGLGEEQDEEQEPEPEPEPEKDEVSDSGALHLLLNKAVGNGGAVR